VIAKTTVVNLKAGERCDVFIGRPSKWGNPFKIGQDGDRFKVVMKYAQWMEKKMQNVPALRDQIIRELGGKRLGCFCAPERCHGDVLAIIANMELDTEKGNP
jgi:hypothetical protein